MSTSYIARVTVINSSSTLLYQIFLLTGTDDRYYYNLAGNSQQSFSYQYGTSTNSGTRFSAVCCNSIGSTACTDAYQFPPYSSILPIVQFALSTNNNASSSGAQTEVYYVTSSEVNGVVNIQVSLDANGTPTVTITPA
jgi:hypothetical protein